MRFVRLLGALVIFYGLSYLQFGGVQLFEALLYKGTRQINWYVIASNINIGIVTVIIGTGVLLAKEWARTLWLMCSIALLSIHIFLLVMFYTDGVMARQHVFNTVLIFILILISWTKLTRPEVKELFH